MTLQQLNHWLLLADFDPEQKIEAVTAIYDKTGVSESTQNMMQNYHDKALVALEKIELPADQKKTLIAFAGEAMKRIK